MNLSAGKSTSPLLDWLVSEAEIDESGCVVDWLELSLPPFDLRRIFPSPRDEEVLLVCRLLDDANPRDEDVPLVLRLLDDIGFLLSFPTTNGSIWMGG